MRPRSGTGAGPDAEEPFEDADSADADHTTKDRQGQRGLVRVAVDRNGSRSKTWLATWSCEFVQGGPEQ